MSGLRTEQDGRNEANRSLMGDRPLDLIGDRKCAKCGFSLWLHGSDLGCPEEEPGLDGCVCPGPDTCAGPPCNTAYWRHV